MRLFLSLSLRTSIYESASAQRPLSTIVSGARYQHPSTPSRIRAYVSCPATAPAPQRHTGARAMSSSAADVPSGGIKADECEAGPAVVENKDSQEKEEEEEEPKLPPLTAAQFREFNRMADHMDYFHNHFRQIWTMMYTACENKKRPAGMTIRRFLDEGLQFISMLTTHHSIEESYVFPMLAKRMPEFQEPDKKSKAPAPKTKGSAKAAELIKQHRDIHKGMDAFEDYMRRCRTGETELEMSVLKAQMDTWGTVLWQHLDEEVATLGAENMRKYWTIDEVRKMRM